jgi:hypothetical protein
MLAVVHRLKVGLGRLVCRFLRGRSSTRSVTQRTIPSSG